MRRAKIDSANLVTICQIWWHPHYIAKHTISQVINIPCMKIIHLFPKGRLLRSILFRSDVRLHPKWATSAASQCISLICWHAYSLPHPWCALIVDFARFHCVVRDASHWSAAQISYSQTIWSSTIRAARSTHACKLKSNTFFGDSRDVYWGGDGVAMAVSAFMCARARDDERVSWTARAGWENPICD